MLVRLSLRDFAIVDAADIDFASGFTALSGETGAGKSILIDALGLALGSRADPTVVREGTSRAEISAEFEVDNSLDAWLDERALTGDAGLLIARRVIDSDGRSRAFINGHTVTATQLREAGQLLLDLHSQNATQAMLRADGQRDLLDRFAGLTDETHAVGQAFDRWKSANDKLDLARSNQRSLALERERLEWQANEIGQLKLQQSPAVALRVAQAGEAAGSGQVRPRPSPASPRAPALSSVTSSTSGSPSMSPPATPWRGT